MKKKIATFKEIEESLVETKLWMENVRSFLQDHIMIKFRKNS